MSGTLTSGQQQDQVTPQAFDAGAPPLAAAERLRKLIDQAAEYLPTQGPVTVFVAMNTLQAFESLPFDDGVRAAAELYHCEPYLTEDRYRDKAQAGRIRVEDLMAEVRADLGDRAEEPILSFGTRFQLRLAMLRFPLQQASGNELQWFMAEADALRVFRPETPFATKQRVLAETRGWIGQLAVTDGHGLAGHTSPEVAGVMAELLKEHATRPLERWSDADWEAITLESLWRICRHGIHAVHDPKEKPRTPVRHREALLQVTGHDSDLLVHDVLIRFCAAFLDQGFSEWSLPHRDLGFARAFAELHADSILHPERWRAGLSVRLQPLRAPEFDPLRSIADSLRRLGVAESDWQDYLTATLVALRGWAGMIRQVELRGDRVARPIPAGSLDQFLAVRLLLECAALEFLAREWMDWQGPLHELKGNCLGRRHRSGHDRLDQRAFVLFQLAQQLGWLPKDLLHLPKEEWRVLVQEIEAFNGLERRKIYQLAFERNFRIRILDALAFRSTMSAKPAREIRYQVVTCLDDREESFRRHLEESCETVETYGAAGFFNVPMYYRGAADAHYVPLCPIVMRPSHWIREEVVPADHAVHEKQAHARKLFGHTLHQLQQRSQTFWGGAFIAAGLGALASFPLVLRVLFPRLAAQLRSSAGSWVLPQHTQLKLERTAAEPSMNPDGIGFSVAEMAAFAERLLTDIGLVRDFAPLVVILGHGSTSLNNPHKSAYDCGACGGGAGGPNARAIGEILDRADVRAKLVERGIVIPEQVAFIGGLHNTCNDHVTFYPPANLSDAHRDQLQQFQVVLDEVCRRNAHERSRRFLSADLSATFAEAHRHTEARSEDLAQARPEYGHSTVACAFVGRRSRTQGLFLDRRSFLVSYDPTQDDAEFSILSRVVTPVVPVCTGIAMQYFFSYMDSPGWGSDTKLPHNVTSMIGVMDGMSSDLRTGLPRQGVDIHEPQRLLIILETPKDSLPIVFQKVPYLEQLARNRWLQLATIEPDSDRIYVYHRGELQPYDPESHLVPRAASSWEWYRGRREPLPFAIIE